MFKNVRNWFARWTWKKAYRKLYPVVMEALKGLILKEFDEIKVIIEKDGADAISEISKKVDEIEDILR